jgi:hypothetical protein
MCEIDPKWSGLENISLLSFPEISIKIENYGELR